MHDFAVLISWVIRSSLYKATKLYAHRRMILKFTILIDILSVKIPLRLTNMGYSSCRFNKLQKVKSFIPVINIGCELSLQKNQKFITQKLLYCTFIESKCTFTSFPFYKDNISLFVLFSKSLRSALFKALIRLSGRKCYDSNISIARNRETHTYTNQLNVPRQLLVIYHHGKQLLQIQLMQLLLLIR